MLITHNHKPNVHNVMTQHNSPQKGTTQYYNYHRGTGQLAWGVAVGDLESCALKGKSNLPMCAVDFAT